jgi:hypothetical protein
MGKGITKTDYDRSKKQLKTCHIATCPNAGADPDGEGIEYCAMCKTARRTAREFERANK